MKHSIKKTFGLAVPSLITICALLLLQTTPAFAGGGGTQFDRPVYSCSAEKQIQNIQRHWINVFEYNGNGWEKTVRFEFKSDGGYGERQVTVHDDEGNQIGTYSFEEDASLVLSLDSALPETCTLIESI